MCPLGPFSAFRPIDRSIDPLEVKDFSTLQVIAAGGEDPEAVELQIAIDEFETNSEVI